MRAPAVAFILVHSPLARTAFEPAKYFELMLNLLAAR